MAKVNADSVVKKLDTATDKSTKALVTAANNLSKVVADLSSQAALNEQLAEAIQVNQNELNSLDAQLDVKVREHNADLALRIRENEEKTLSDLLKRTGRADVSVEELRDLRAEVETLSESQEEAVAKAVNAVRANAENAARAAQKELEAEHSVQTAEYKARIASLSSQIEYLTEQVKTYKQMLDDERAARVEAANASARAAEANRAVVTGSQSR